MNTVMYRISSTSLRDGGVKCSARATVVLTNENDGKTLSRYLFVKVSKYLYLVRIIGRICLRPVQCALVSLAHDWYRETSLCSGCIFINQS